MLAAGLMPAASAIGVSAQPALVFPLECRLGETCFLQSHVDRDPGPGAADFTCGPASYDGHKGTDFRLATRAEIADGVAVLAAAPGAVRAVRDGMADRRLGETPDVSGRECGNGVVIDHEDGWSTQYCHLRRGSVAVAPGDRVVAGDRLGLVGLSGETEFPHLHLTLRRGETVIDPFTGAAIDTPCGPGDSLWAEPIPPQIGEIMLAGFATGIPDYATIRTDPPRPDRLAADAPALVVWTHAIALRAGDRLVLTLRDPQGRVVAEDVHAMPRNRATQYRAVGLRRPAGGWVPGRWTGEVALMRGEEAISRQTVALTLD